MVLQLRLTRNRCLALLTLAFLCFHPHIAGSESLTLTTYYPAPYGGYVSLLTTGAGNMNTLLVRDGGNVGIRTGSVTPGQPLSVGGAASFDVSAAYPNGKGMIYNTVGGAEGETLRLTSNGGTHMYMENFSGSLRLVNSSWTKELMSVDQNGNLAISESFTLSGAGAQKMYGVCVQKAYAFNSMTPCPANHIPVAHWGDGTARTYGFLPAGPIPSTPYNAGTFIGLGQDFGGTMLCCRFNIP